MVVGRNNGMVGLTGISDMKLSELLFASRRSGRNIGMVGMNPTPTSPSSASVSFSIC